MKLQNKKTGEIVVVDITRMVSGVEFDCGQTLAELNAEWEDYEEPKTFWHIMPNGGIIEREITSDETRQEFIEDSKEIGNYFETKEEAEKAVEKLKAWKRLKENKYLFGKFIDLIYSLNARSREFDEYMNDITLLFGEK